MKKELKKSLIFWGIVILAFAGFILFKSLTGNIILTSEGTTSYSFLEDNSYQYNFSINNTETLSSGNITQVNVTLPSSFNFSSDSNGSNSGENLFQRAGNILSWTNSSALVMNLTLKHFWFNASAPTPGNYNLTISIQNQSGVFSSNLSVSVNDTTPPASILFVSPTEDNQSVKSRNYIKYNISATDNLAIGTITVFLYNSSFVLNSSNSSTSSPFSGNFSGLAQGDYYLNVSVNDSAGNINYSETRLLSLHTTAPEVTLVYPGSADTVTSSPYRFTFQVSSGITVKNCTLILNNVGVNNTTDISSSTKISRVLTNGAYNWSVNCTDEAGNIGTSSKRNFTVSLNATTTTTTTTTTTPVTTTTATNNSSSNSINYTNVPINKTQLLENYSHIVPKNVELSFELANDSHSVKITNVTNTSVNIIVASTPQQATLLIGEEKKFEINGDNYRDLKVKLNSINSTGYANITIKEIHELITNTSSTNNSTLKDDEDNTSSLGVILIVGFVILLIGGVVFGIAYFLKKNKKDNEEKLKVNNSVLGQGSESNPNGQIYQPRY